MAKMAGVVILGEDVSAAAISFKFYSFNIGIIHVFFFMH